MVSFICNICGKEYKLNSSLRRHHRIHHEEPSSSIKCIPCNRYFSDQSSYQHHLLEHSKTEEGETNVNCTDCKQYIPKANWHYHVRTNQHKINCAKICNDVDEIKYIKSVFNHRIITYLIKNNNKSDLIPENFLSDIKYKVVELLRNMTQKFLSIKFNLEIFCEYMLVKEEQESCTIEVKSHQTKMSIVNLSSSTTEDILNIYNEQCDNIIKKMSEFQERDSGWTLTEILRLEININQYKCIKGSQYIALPSKVQKKLACINVQNNDEYCFKWAIISALFPINVNSNRCTSYKVRNIRDDIITLENNIVLNFKSLNFPLSTSKIKMFEINNPEISVNVFGLNEKDDVVGPYYSTSKEKDKHINLLLLEDGVKFHYVWIRNISRYVFYCILFTLFDNKNFFIPD